MRRGKNQKLIIKIMTAHTFSKWRVKVLKARTVSINHFCQIPWQFSSFKRRVKILTTRTFSKNHVSLKHSDEGGRERGYETCYIKVLLLCRERLRKTLSLNSVTSLKHHLPRAIQVTSLNSSVLSLSLCPSSLCYPMWACVSLHSSPQPNLIIRNALPRSFALSALNSVFFFGVFTVNLLPQTFATLIPGFLRPK